MACCYLFYLKDDFFVLTWQNNIFYNDCTIKFKYDQFQLINREEI